MIEVKEGKIHQILHIVALHLSEFGYLGSKHSEDSRVILDILQDSPSLLTECNDETCNGRFMHSPA